MSNQSLGILQVEAVSFALLLAVCVAVVLWDLFTSNQSLEIFEIDAAKFALLSLLLCELYLLVHLMLSWHFTDSSKKDSAMSDADSQLASNSSITDDAKDREEKKKKKKKEEPGLLLIRSVMKNDMWNMCKILFQPQEADDGSRAAVSDDYSIEMALRRAIIMHKSFEKCSLLFDSISESGKQKHYSDKSNSVECLLHLVVKEGELKLLRFLIGERHCNVNQMNRYGHTPLKIAVGKNSLAMSRVLLTNGADPNRCQHWSQHVLAGAYNCSTALFRLLLEHGADPNYAVNPTQSHLLTAQTIKYGAAERLGLLLQYGAILDAPAEVMVRNQDALHWMLHAHQTFIPNETKQSTCRVLMHHAKSITTSKKGITMDFFCTSMIDVCQLMVQEHGIDPFPQKEGEASLFQSAASQSNTEIFAFFLDHWDDRFLYSAYNDGKDDHGRFPIHVVCRFSNVSLAALQLVMERQPHTLAIAAPAVPAVAVLDDGQQQQQGRGEGRQLFPFLAAGIHDANLDVIYSLLRHCPDALTRQQE